MKKIWNQLGHSLFAEDESSRKTKHILKTVFFFYILVLLKVIVFKYPLAAAGGDRCFLDKGGCLGGTWNRQLHFI